VITEDRDTSENFESRARSGPTAGALEAPGSTQMTKIIPDARLGADALVNLRASEAGQAACEPRRRREEERFGSEPGLPCDGEGPRRPIPP